MEPKHTTLVKDLNPVLTCPICKGYLVDAATLTECFHTFCRSCIIKHLKRVGYCQVCEVQGNQKHPEKCLRPDVRKQLLVYKAVPHVYNNEINARRAFIEKFGGKDAHGRPITTPSLTDEVADYLFEDDSKMSISLEMETAGSVLQGVVPGNKRYLMCPAAFPVRHLKKFLRLKYQLKPSHEIDIMYDTEILDENFTLKDVAYSFRWRGGTPLRFVYRIRNKDAVPTVEPKKEEDVPVCAAPLRRPPRSKSRSRGGVSSGGSSDESNVAQRRQLRQRTAKTAACNAIEAMEEDTDIDDEPPVKRPRRTYKSPRRDSDEANPYRSTRGRTPRASAADVEDRYNRGSTTSRVYSFFARADDDDESSDDETKKNTLANSRPLRKRAADIYEFTLSNNEEDDDNYQNGPAWTNNSREGGRVEGSELAENDLVEEVVSEDPGTDAMAEADMEAVTESVIDEGIEDDMIEEVAGTENEEGETEDPRSDMERNESYRADAENGNEDEAEEMEDDDDEVDEDGNREYVISLDFDGDEPVVVVEVGEGDASGKKAEECKEEDDMEKVIEEDIEEVEEDELALDESEAHVESTDTGEVEGADETFEEDVGDEQMDDSSEYHDEKDTLSVVVDDDITEEEIAQVLAEEDDETEAEGVSVDPHMGSLAEDNEDEREAEEEVKGTEQDSSGQHEPQGDDTRTSSESQTVDEDDVPEIVHEKVLRKKSKKSKESRHHRHHHHRHKVHWSPELVPSVVTSPDEAPMKLTLKLRPTPSISPISSSSRKSPTSVSDEVPAKQWKVDDSNIERWPSPKGNKSPSPKLSLSCKKPSSPTSMVPSREPSLKTGSSSFPQSKSQSTTKLPTAAKAVSEETSVTGYDQRNSASTPSPNNVSSPLASPQAPASPRESGNSKASSPKPASSPPVSVNSQSSKDDKRQEVMFLGKRAVPDEVKERLMQMRAVRHKSTTNAATDDVNQIPLSDKESQDLLDESSAKDLKSELTVKTPASLSISKLEAGETRPRIETSPKKPALEIVMLPPSPPPPQSPKLKSQNSKKDAVEYITIGSDDTAVPDVPEQSSRSSPLASPHDRVQDKDKQRTEPGNIQQQDFLGALDLSGKSKQAPSQPQIPSPNKDSRASSMAPVPKKPPSQSSITVIAQSLARQKLQQRQQSLLQKQVQKQQHAQHQQQLQQRQRQSQSPTTASSPTSATNRPTGLQTVIPTASTMMSLNNLRNLIALSDGNRLLSLPTPKPPQAASAPLLVRQAHRSLQPILPKDFTPPSIPTSAALLRSKPLPGLNELYPARKVGPFTTTDAPRPNGASTPRPGPNQTVRHIPNPSALLQRHHMAQQQQRENLMKQAQTLAEYELKERLKTFQNNMAANGINGNMITSAALNNNNNVSKALIARPLGQPRSIEKVAAGLSIRAAVEARAGK